MANPKAAAPGKAAQDLLAAMANIPRQKLEHIAAIAKSAKARVGKADGDVPEGDMPGDEVLPEDAQNALKAAFRILAPYSDNISAGTMADFADALGVEADVEMVDTDEATEVSQSADSDDEDDVGKAADKDADADKLDNLTKADDGDDEEEAKKADASDEEIKDEVEGEDVPPSVAKADGMPDFDGASDADKEAAMAAARTAYADAMKQRGIEEATQKSADNEDEDDKDEAKKSDDAMAKSDVAKSAFALHGLDKAQRRVLEPILKSHFDRFAQIERANKELVAKSAKLDTEMRRREFIAKAATEYSALGRPEEIGENLLRLHQKDPDGVAAWERIMKAANEQMRAGGADGLFGELGTAMGNPPSTGSSADDQIKQHVDSMVQKSASNKTREQLEAEFLQTPIGRRLYSAATNKN